MGQRFGRDFSSVRVHADSKAAAAAEAVDALAFTVGQHIVFGHDRLDAGSPFGRALLAHELQHTVQQGELTSIPTELQVGGQTDPEEREAERAAGEDVGRWYRPEVRTPVRLARAPATSSSPVVFEHNTELGGLSVGNFDFHLRNCSILVWVWLKFQFDDDITAPEQASYKKRFVDAVHRTWAHTGYFLTGSDACPCRSIPIEIHCEENPRSYYHKLVDVEKKHDWERRPKVISDINVNLYTPDDTLAHEFGHVLGLYDEYDGGFFENIMFWHKNRPDDPRGLMNKGLELRPRYFEHYRRRVQETAGKGCTYAVSSPKPPVP